MRTSYSQILDDEDASLACRSDWAMKGVSRGQFRHPDPETASRTTSDGLFHGGTTELTTWNIMGGT